MPSPFPSLKAHAMLRLLMQELGYTQERQDGTSHKKLSADGRPT